ncbi:MAG: gliding motility-associated-like protein [Algoriphagus sp.]|jgi:gliding motility-associated-like protein
MKNEIFSKPFRWLRTLQLLIWIVFFGFSISKVGAQTVIIPRDGFPYCEPFTNSTTRANTVFDGIPNQAILTANAGTEGAGFLRLTDNSTDQRGYVFIDLPFSSAYGIKVSFEYFAYGGTNPPAYADGISFFMFDGDIGPDDGVAPSSPTEFQIGGLGGSLGYSPWRSNNGLLTQPGLKGAYIGIGFDAFRNWGNEYEGRFGGFRDPTATGFGAVPDERQYYNSIAVRGPASTNYQFIDGRRTYSRSFLNEEQSSVYLEPINSFYYLFDALDPMDYLVRRFKIGSQNRAETCPEDGYRKVFIDLFPVGAGNYLLTVDMLVNNAGTLRLENIFTDLPYNFPAPRNLKIGFAASTGNPNTNFHEIRNVTAQVSDYASIPIPEIQNLDAEVCQDEENIFEFDVKLISENSFVRCVQLFETNPGPPDNSAPNGGDPSLTNCGLSNVCIEKCDPQNNSITIPSKGTFTVILEELTIGNFDIDRFKASVNFVPVPGFIGEASVYYQVLDNYGLISEAKTITVISNPFPSKLQDPSFDYPTCSGKPDGRLFDLIIKDLIPGFDYEWFRDGTSIGKSGASVSALTNGEVTFELDNLLVGIYSLSVWNPSDKGICERSFSFLIDKELGTPVDLDLPAQVICEGDDVTFSPLIDPSFGSDAGATFLWYLSPDRSGGVIASGSTITIDGQPVTFTIQSNRNISISGLVSNGNAPKTYSFYVEAQPISNPSGNFCPYLGDVLTVGTVEVYPPLDITVTKTSDWCLDNSGSITASVANPTSSITYSLLDQSGNVLFTNTNGQFNGLGPGVYEAVATSANPQCSQTSSPFTIEGPTDPLTLAAGSTVNAYCSDSNGSLSFTLQGGNPAYSISLDGNLVPGLTPVGNVYTINNLAAKLYSIAVTDSKNCSSTISMVVNGDPVSQFGTTNDEICEGEVAIVSRNVVTLSSSVPVYKWYYKDAGGNFQPITNGLSLSGVNFAIDGSNQLSVSNLAPQATPYTYYLNVTGTKVCDQGYIPAEILVNPVPKPAAPILTQVTCNGAANGSIQAQLISGNLADFEYSLIGNNGVNRPFTTNSGLFNLLPPGTYELLIKSAKGCEASMTNLIITEPSPLVLTPVSVENSYCSLANGSLKFNLQGGTQFYTITIDGNPLTSPLINGTEYTLNNLAAGTYSIRVVDDKGCQTSISQVIAADPPSVFGTTNDEICEDEVASVSPTVLNLSSSVPVYKWYYKDAGGNFQPIPNGLNLSGVLFTIDGSNKLSVSNLAPQATTYTYYLNVTGTKVCDQGYIPAEILVNPFPKPTAPILTQVTCNGAANGIIQAQLTSGNLADFEYSLIGNNGVNRPFTTNSGLFNLLPPGTYELFIKSAKGCEASMTNLIITEPSLLEINQVSKTDATCATNNGEIRFTVAGATPDPTGKYTIKVNGADITTFGTNLTTNGPADFTLSDLSPGIYTIEAEDVNGCKDDLSITIQNTAVPVFDVDDVTVCEGTDAILTPKEISNTIGAVPVYAWSYENPSNPGQYIQINDGDVVNGITYTLSNGILTINGLKYSAVNYNYYLAVTGTNVCPPAPIQAEVKVLKIPEAVFEPVPVTCFGESNGEIKLGSVDPVGPNTYTLVQTGATNTTGNFGGLMAGSYTVNVQENGSPCFAEFEVEVTEPAPLAIQNLASVDPTCGDSNGSIKFEIVGGITNYLLVLNNKPISDFTNSLIAGVYEVENLAPGTYSLGVTDANGCELNLPDLFTLTNDAGFNVVLNPIQEEVCFGQDLVLSPVFTSVIPVTPFLNWYKDAASTQPITSSPTPDSDGITYQINPSSGVLTISGQKAGNYIYYLEISGSGICTLVESALAQVFPVPTADITVKDVTCFGGNDGEIKFISVDPVGPNTFTLVQTGATNTTGNFGGLTAGSYTVKVQENGSPCFAEFEVEVTEPAPLAIQNLASLNPSCGDSNGSIKFEIVGGITDYLLVLNNKPISDYTNSLTAGLYEVKNLAPGTYSLGVTDANGCELNLPDLFTLTNDAGFNVVLNPIQEEVCFGQDLVLSPVFTSVIPVTPLLNWYKDAASTQPITSSPTPDSDGVTYQINPSNGVLTISGQKAGNYTYYLEVSGSGICTLVESAIANVLPELLANITVENITCFGDTDGTITIVPSGGNGNFETSLNGSAFTTNLIYSNLAPGSYKIDLRNDIGCAFTETVIVETSSAAISINSPTIERASCDLSNGSIKDLVISGGWGSYAVEWRKGSQTGPVIPGDLSQAINLAPDLYFIIITDSEGCEQVFDFLIEESSDPVYAIVPPINSCFGTPVTIRPIHIAPDPSLPPAAATEIRWYTGPGQIGLIQDGPDAANSAIQYTIDDTDWLNPELVITGLPAGTHDFYFYVVCTGQEIKIDIAVFDIPSVVLETEPIVCFGDTNGKVIVLSGGIPAYTYSVNGGDPINQIAFEALNLAAGTYSLAIATPAGCAQNLNFTISGPSAPLASSPLTKIDPGCGALNGKLNFTMAGGWLPYTLDVIKDGVSQGLQTLNQSNISLDGYRPGVYQIRITDNEGCLVITNTVTLVDGPTQILADSDEICVGSVASLLPELNPVATGVSFQWFLDAAKTQPIVSSPSPATDGRIYQINSATGELTIGNLPASATEYNYFVTASGSGVCPGFTGNGKVKVYSNPTVTAAVVNEVCFGTGGSITITTSGESGPHVYSLNGGAFGSTNVFQVATGIYNVQVSTPEGCLVNVTNIQVAGPGEALTTGNLLKDDTSCGLDNGEIRFTISGGYAPYSIIYTKNGSNAGSTSLVTAGEVRISNLGIGVYEFKVIDAQGCSITVPNTVTLTEIATVLTANDDEICEGEIAQSTPSVAQNIPDPQFIWSFDSQGSSLISNEIVNGVTFEISASGALTVAGLSPRSAPYIYFVVATGVGICGLEYKPVSIKVNGLPVLRVSNPSVICDPNGKVDLTDYIEGFNPSVYDYSVLSPSGNSMLLNELNNVGVSGDYRVSSSFKGMGCFNQSQRIRVLIAETELIANFQYEADLGGGFLLSNGEVQIQEDVNFQDLSLGNVLIWDWNFGDGNSSSIQNPVHQYQEKGTYVVKLTTIDSIGCISSYEIVVQVLDDYIVMIPNAFTPTGAKNLTLRPYYRGIATMEFYIFNTWGELIYEAKSMEDQGWDGTLNGKNVPNGNYVYKGRFVSRSGEVINKAGVFVLIR